LVIISKSGNHTPAGTLPTQLTGSHPHPVSRPMPYETAEILKMYPEVEAACGLGAALDVELEKLGSPIRASRPDHSTRITVKRGSRLGMLTLRADQRQFIFELHARGAFLARGAAPSLDAIARAFGRWLGSSCTAAEIAAELPFVTPEPDAEAYENNTVAEVRWQGYLARASTKPGELAPFVTAAARRPELRQLMPYTSMFQLCFSRCTGFPFTQDTPRVQPVRGGSGFEVVAPITGAILGRGDAEEAVELVLRHLPPGIGPAVPGTADDVKT